MKRRAVGRLILSKPAANSYQTPCCADAPAAPSTCAACRWRPEAEEMCSRVSHFMCGRFPDVFHVSGEMNLRVVGTRISVLFFVFFVFLSRLLHKYFQQKKKKKSLGQRFCLSSYFIGFSNSCNVGHLSSDWGLSSFKCSWDLNSGAFDQ